MQVVKIGSNVQYAICRESQGKRVNVTLNHWSAVGDTVLSSIVAINKYGGIPYCLYCKCLGHKHYDRDQEGRLVCPMTNLQDNPLFTDDDGSDSSESDISLDDYPNYDSVSSISSEDLGGVSEDLGQQGSSSPQDPSVTERHSALEYSPVSSNDDEPEPTGRGQSLCRTE